MPGDGVSLPTTLAQLGAVAKAQVRATNQPQPAAPFAELQEQKGELSARRVQETAEDTAGRKIESGGDGLDKRQRRRQRRQGRGENPADEAADDDEGTTANDTSPLGHLVDLRA